MKDILILYYSKNDSTKKMARAISRGIESVPNISSVIRTVKSKNYKENDDLLVTKEDLKSCNEEIIFTIINNQILNKKSTLITSTKELDKSDFELNDLYSRLFSDRIYNISDLSDEDKINLMISRCSEKGLEVSEKVLNYIMNNCSRDLYFLCAFINSLDYASLSTKRRVTIPFIKQAIKDLTS